MDFILPLDISQGAMLRGNEYGWSVSSFPDALARAEAHGFACLGGQFQFRLEEATCEMYWLEALKGTGTTRIMGGVLSSFLLRSPERVPVLGLCDGLCERGIELAIGSNRPDQEPCVRCVFRHRVDLATTLSQAIAQ